ncbi:hypothetical protein O3G_MSEX010097, partial [Manduca sexta]
AIPGETREWDTEIPGLSDCRVLVESWEETAGKKEWGRTKKPLRMKEGRTVVGVIHHRRRVRASEGERGRAREAVDACAGGDDGFHRRSGAYVYPI